MDTSLDIIFSSSKFEHQNPADPAGMTRHFRFCSHRASQAFVLKPPPFNFVVSSPKMSNPKISAFGVAT
jgi:hypothetical protein